MTNTRRASPHARSRPSSRELLREALQRAQTAVQFDKAKSDLPAAVAAYEEAIALLQRVIERRAQILGAESEVKRVTEIVSHSHLAKEGAPTFP
jgi:hypothetical protein